MTTLEIDTVAEAKYDAAFSVGDDVLIIGGVPNRCDHNSGIFFAPSMAKFIGQQTIITGVQKLLSGAIAYSVGNSSYIWAESWLIPGDDLPAVDVGSLL